MQSAQTSAFSESQGDLWVLGIVVKMLGFVIWIAGYTPFIWVPLLVIAMMMIVAGIYKFHHT